MRDATHELQARIEAIAGAAGGTWHVYARVWGETLYEREADRAVRSASTSKLVVLLSVLQAVDAGSLSLDQPLAVPPVRVGGAGVLSMLPSVTSLSLREMLALMMGVSDNNATNAVIGLVGLPAINATAAAAGAHNTVMGRLMMDVEAMNAGRDNVATACGLVAVTEHLLTPGLALSSGGVDSAREILGLQQFNERIPALLPLGTVVLHKTGELDGFCHNAGAVTLTNGRLLHLAILGADIAPSNAHTAGDTIARISRELVAAAEGDLVVV